MRFLDTARRTCLCFCVYGSHDCLICLPLLQRNVPAIHCIRQCSLSRVPIESQAGVHYFTICRINQWYQGDTSVEHIWAQSRSQVYSPGKSEVSLASFPSRARTSNFQEATSAVCSAVLLRQIPASVSTGPEACSKSTIRSRLLGIAWPSWLRKVFRV